MKSFLCPIPIRSCDSPIPLLRPDFSFLEEAILGLVYRTEMQSDSKEDGKNKKREAVTDSAFYQSKP